MAKPMPLRFPSARKSAVVVKQGYMVESKLLCGRIIKWEAIYESAKFRFDAVSHALKSGGKHFMDICNAEHAEHYFSRQSWEAGEKALALAKFEWNGKTRRMLYGGCDIPYGVSAKKPDITMGDPARLYSVAELHSILQRRKMSIIRTFSNYYGKEASVKELQLLVYSRKQ